jgi:hypothetical protein
MALVVCLGVGGLVWGSGPYDGADRGGVSAPGIRRGVPDFLRTSAALCSVPRSKARLPLRCKHWVVVAIWSVILASCGSARQPDVAKVEIHITSGGGYAYCGFTADGWTEGGHESGGPQPFVHVERERIPREQVGEIWEAAKAVDARAYPLEESAVRECVECVDVFIYYSDGLVMHLSWPFGEQHSDPKVQHLEALLTEYAVGGW